MKTKNWKIFIFTISFMLFVCFIFILVVHAQYWTPLPPYNVLWPLWSPALSPLDPVTGVPTPLAVDLFSSTILPVQPGLAWDPSLDYPLFLNNSPVGMQYYDIIYGLDPWPPPSFIDPVTGAPLPISLPLGYSTLPATESTTDSGNLPIANLAYLAED